MSEDQFLKSLANFDLLKNLGEGLYEKQNQKMEFCFFSNSKFSKKDDSKVQCAPLWVFGQLWWF